MILEGKAGGVSSSMTSLRHNIESVKLLRVNVKASLFAGELSISDHLLVVLLFEINPAISAVAIQMLFH